MFLDYQNYSAFKIIQLKINNLFKMLQKYILDFANI